MTRLIGRMLCLYFAGFALVMACASEGSLTEPCSAARLSAITTTCSTELALACPDADTDEAMEACAAGDPVREACDRRIETECSK